MRKRNTGYILLVLLVITGFAGTIGTSTLSEKERKFVVNDLKESRHNFLKSIKGLSAAQLNFKPSVEKWSIKECVQHIATTEQSLWQFAETALKQPINPQKHIEIKLSDEEILKGTTDKTTNYKIPEVLQPGKATWTTLSETLNAYKKQRNSLIGYMKTTTENLRGHIAQTPIGAADAYQVALLVSAHSSRHTLQINEIKADPRFPKH